MCGRSVAWEQIGLDAQRGTGRVRGSLRGSRDGQWGGPRIARRVCWRRRRRGRGGLEDGPSNTRNGSILLHTLLVQLFSQRLGPGQAGVAIIFAQGGWRSGLSDCRHARECDSAVQRPADGICGVDNGGMRRDRRVRPVCMICFQVVRDGDKEVVEVRGVTRATLRTAVGGDIRQQAVIAQVQSEW